jgi:hypothetical protein
MGWRDHIKVHPACELFPRMSESELKELSEDIKKNGLKHPAMAWYSTYDAYKKGEQPVLLDGRNRFEAMEAAGIVIDLAKCHFHFGDRGCDPYAYVISANIQRRHLTAEQRIGLVAELVKANPAKSDRQIAKQVKVSPTTVGKVRSSLEAKGDVSTVDTRTDARGRHQPANKPKPRPVKAPPPPAQQSADDRKQQYAAEEEREIKTPSPDILETSLNHLERVIDLTVKIWGNADRLPELIGGLRKYIDRVEAEAAHREIGEEIGADPTKSDEQIAKQFGVASRIVHFVRENTLNVGEATTAPDSAIPDFLRRKQPEPAAEDDAIAEFLDRRERAL